jgi:predicted amidohydrolase
VRVALVQMYCGWGEVEDNRRRAEAHVRQAARQGADLVLFPEMSAQGMWKDHLVRLAAEPLDGPIVKRMARCARRNRVAIAFGLAEKTPGKPFNTCVLLDNDGRLIGAYRKNHVTPLERDYLRGDRRRPTFRIGSLRVGVAICADNTHPELIAGYARRGADLILMPHAWDADPILTNGRAAGWRHVEDMVDHFARGKVERFRTHDEMYQAFVARLAPICAREKVCAAFVNQVGRPHPLIPFVGPSFALDRTGKVIARSRSAREGVLIADLPL